MAKFINIKITILTIFSCLLLFNIAVSPAAEDVVKPSLIKGNGMVSDVINNTVDNKSNIPINTAVAGQKNIVPNISNASNLNVNGAIKTDDPAKIISGGATTNTQKTDSLVNPVTFSTLPKVKTVETNKAEEKAKEALPEKEINLLMAAEHKENESKKNSKNESIAQKHTPKPVGGRDGVREIPFVDNEQVNVVLSNRDINRVLIKGDKIQSVNGPTGLYMAKNDMTGAAYISLYGETAFTVFISTVKGHNVSLLVTPRSVTGKTVILESTSLSVERFEEAESYQKTLVDFITAMINREINGISGINEINEMLGSYVYSEGKKSQNNKKVDFYGIADVKQVGSYNGASLIGIVSEITNKSAKPITLKPSYFYRHGIRAIALSQQTIAPSETGLLYQVISRN